MSTNRARGSVHARLALAGLILIVLSSIDPGSHSRCRPLRSARTGGESVLLLTAADIGREVFLSVVPVMHSGIDVDCYSGLAHFFFFPRMCRWYGIIVLRCVCGFCVCVCVCVCVSFVTLVTLIVAILGPFFVVVIEIVLCRCCGLIVLLGDINASCVG